MDLRGTGWGVKTVFLCSGYRILVVAGSCEHENESSDSIECWEILNWLSDY
jgi:hypothetical protein